MSVITNKWNDGSGDSINIESPSFQGNQTVKISSPVQKGTSKRSMKFIGKCKKNSSKQVILTVEQEASTYTYDLTLNSDNTEIAAKGGTANITAVLKTYRNGNLVSTDNVTPVLSGSATGFSISGTKVTASNRGISAGVERSITITGKFSDTFDGQTVSSTIVIKQSENYIISLKIGGGSTTQFLSPTITYSAAGGSNPFTGWVVYSSGEQANVDTWTNDNWILPELYFTKSIANGILTVTGEYRGITVGNKRTGVLTLSLNSVSTNNKTIETSLTLTQDANVETNITYSNINITYFTYSDIPASGGSVSPKLAYTQAKIQHYSSGGSKNLDTISSGATLTYSKSGTAGGGSINATTGVVSVGTRGTTVGNRWEVGRFIVVIKLNGKEISTNTVCYQEANKATSISYGVPTVNLTVNDIPASGGTISSGTVSYSQSRTQNYTSGATSALSALTTGGTVSYSTAVSANSLGTTVKVRNKVGTLTATVSMNGQSGSKSVDVYQQENLATYGTLTGGSISAFDIPASGGTSTTSVSNMSQTISYTSGSTRAGTVTYSKTSEITVSSLGTTVKARTKVGQVTVTYTGEGSVTAKKTVDIYQAENKVTNSNYNPRITAYGIPTISIGSGLTAAGGSAKVSTSVTNTETYNALYSSGATGPNQTRSVTGNVSVSMTANGNNRFSLSGNTITHSSMGTAETTDIVTIKAVNAGDSSKSATASKSIVNSKTVKSTSGGVYTYGNIIAGTITNATIPASGGSATAKAGNGTQSWNKSATITTYQYDSGSTKDVTTENASSGTNNVSPSIASIKATASSKGTTVSSQTTVKSQVVTWSANGKSASGTMYIYQAANAIDSYNYGSWNIAISANPTTIAASGGTSTITASCTRTKTPVYTSGSTGTATIESATPTLAISGTGFTLSRTIVTASKNNVAARTAIVTASYSGATSKSVTITQSAGPDGIGYMQIQGNGVDHYIFQVGRTPNTRSNDVQTLSEESVEVATETKSESLFAKIKRIITNLN